jgi:hypothetical protein
MPLSRSRSGEKGGEEEGEEKKETDHGALAWRHHPAPHKVN